MFGWLGSTSWHRIQKAVKASEVTDCRRPHSCCLLCHLFSDFLDENGTLTCGAFGSSTRRRKKENPSLPFSSIQSRSHNRLLIASSAPRWNALISPFSPSAGHVPTPTHVTHPDGLPPKPNGISPKANMSGVCERAAGEQQQRLDCRHVPTGSVKSILHSARRMFGVTTFTSLLLHVRI